MKMLVSLLVITALVFADDEGCAETELLIYPDLPEQDDITLSIVNTWVVSWASQCLGMDCWESGGTMLIVFASRNDVQLNSLDPATGTGGGTQNLDPVNINCFGVVYNNEPGSPLWHTNDWSIPILYYTTDFLTWSVTPNPSGTAGRGMDFDGTDYWIANGEDGVYRFQPGVSQEAISLPEVPTQISGLTTFPYQGDVGLAVTTYNTHNIYFYSWDGSTMSYLGNAACPVSVSSSLGLAYCATRNTIFWSYNSGNYSIAEFEFDIELSFENATWTEIKASF